MSAAWSAGDMERVRIQARERQKARTHQFYREGKYAEWGRRGRAERYQFTEGWYAENQERFANAMREELKRRAAESPSIE
jgi:hypothetical protein